MTLLVCTACGKEHGSTVGWDEKREGCADVAACTKRSITKPYVGDFDPVAAYADAPKIGDE